ncbi:hypothetical protein [Rhizobium mesoamericanum]|uniref:Uncharacterized protein n=1 Tax=Rhizobium mesoamericanum STM3625 TaxID=1211777 RepID=K0PYS1_9HYPH|nr:hypothetical protein [Rhizobium mesoamericanum]CCM75124.1 hypothetical protein BN77_2287 [Rhizobium mesoamericanum STM3625]
MGCNCQDSGKSDAELRKAFAARAMKLAMALPDELTCREKFSAPEAEFLSALRDVAVTYSFAQNWSDSEARAQLDALRLADAAMSFMAKDNGGGGGGPSCTARCTAEKEQCRQNCDNADAGYFCYFDCRLSYMACLASCIYGGRGGGGVVIA